MNFEMPEIFVACEDGDLEQVTELLDRAPDLIGQKFSEDQPLHFACWQKHSEVVALLVDRGADVNAPGDGGKTPLHYAVYEGDQESLPIVKKLLDAGASPLIKERDADQTPIDFAIQEHHEGLAPSIDLLQKSGANPGLASAVYLNDMDLAKRLLAEMTSTDRRKVEQARYIAVHHPGHNFSGVVDRLPGLLPDNLIQERESFVKIMDGWLEQN